MSMEASGFEAVVQALTVIPAQMAPKVKGIVSKGALKIKKQLQDEASNSWHFHPVARSIGYELLETSAGGDTSVEAVIGPDKSRDGAGGLLMAYYGQSNGGGGTLPDPLNALEAEAPNFVDQISRLAAGLG